MGWLGISPGRGLTQFPKRSNHRAELVVGQVQKAFHALVRHQPKRQETDTATILEPPNFYCCCVAFQPGLAHLPPAVHSHTSTVCTYWYLTLFTLPYIGPHPLTTGRIPLSALSGLIRYLASDSLSIVFCPISDCCLFPVRLIIAPHHKCYSV